jgi:hypothetical protein
LFACPIISEERDEFFDVVGLPLDFDRLTKDDLTVTRAMATLWKRIYLKICAMTSSL